jgi:protein-S-isoprenylcysteine O-methyltransferase Ste14
MSGFFSFRRREMNIYKKWASREYPLAVRIAALIPAAGLFLFLIPYTLLVIGPRLDARIGLPDFQFGWVNIVAGAILIIIGGYYALSSIGQQLFDAGGTPLPVMATQKLLVSGVFLQCRNPMTFGIICAYSGVSILKGSISSLGLIFILGALLVLYLRIFEERELEQRFGESYRIYKKSTSFLIPHLTKRK